MKGKHRRKHDPPRENNCKHDGGKSWGAVTLPNGTTVRVRVCDLCGERA